MADAIELTDITDNVISNLGSTVLTPYIVRTTARINDIAEEVGVKEADISDPWHNKVKEYGVAWFCMMVCLEYGGTNNVSSDPLSEKYFVKHEFYKGLEKVRKIELNSSVFVDQIDERSQTSTDTGVIFRN